jgi:hypothetical protein
MSELDLSKPILIYPSDFGERLITERKRLPKRVRRMSARKVKRWLASELRKAWDAARV